MASFWDKRQPCWKLIECPIENRKSCGAYLAQHYPCWELPLEKRCPISERIDSCEECPVYLNYSAEYQVQEDNRAESQAIRVLVVDDEMLIRWSLYQTLRRHGFEADIAADAMEASDKFANNTYDYLMIDYKMPGKDGLAFAEEISHIYPDTRVILMTAFGSEEVERQAHKLGVKYMSKPIDLDHISEILR